MTKSASRLKMALFAAVSALALIGAPTIASAQVSDEIVVTARKREEAAKDVPLSISTVSGQALEQLTSGGQDVAFISARTPSVIAESSFGRTFQRFYVRGLGNTDFDLNASQPVSLVYDDVVYENPVLKGYPVFDLARIEVLRGPQGTLFGRNTPAGIIKFDSVKPSEDKSGYVRVGLRNFGGIDVEGAAGGQLFAGLTGRISLLAQTQDDWIDNTAAAGTTFKSELGGYEEFAGRVQLRLNPNDNFDALLNVHGRDLSGTSQLFRGNIIRPGVGGLVSTFDRERVAYDGGAGNNQDLSTWGVTGTLNIGLGGLTLTSITGYERVDFFGRGDIDGGTAGPPNPTTFPAESADGISLDQVSQEVRLASNNAEGFNWVLGAFYFNEDAGIRTLNFSTATGAVNGNPLQEQETDAWAIFGSATFKPTDRLSLTAGVRYSDDEKDFVASRQLSPIGAPPLTAVRANVGDEAVSWDLAAVFELNDDANLYGRVARGFRAPAIQGRLLFGDVVTTAKSEFLTSYEAGVKSTLFDRRLRSDINVFYYTIDDQQLTAIGGAGNFNQLLNAKESEGYGFEAQAEFAPTENLTFNGSVSYNKTEIQDPNLTVAACGAPCTVTDPLAAPGIARINGNSFPNAPEWIGNVGVSYERPLAGGGAVFASTDWSYKGETNFFLYESREFREDGFWEGGLRVGYRSPNERVTVAAFGRNITDEERLIGAIDFNNLTGFVNGPRVYGAEIKVQY
jgi:iron complex outermembrane receptor protein